MKKVELIRDKSGAVVASQEVSQGEDDGIQGEVVLEDGGSSEIMEVSRSYAEDIDNFLTSFKK